MESIELDLTGSSIASETSDSASKENAGQEETEVKDEIESINLEDQQEVDGKENSSSEEAEVVKDKIATETTKPQQSNPLDPRRLQSERDKIEAAYGKLVKETLPYIKYDQFGNVLGAREIEPQIPKEDADSLYEKALLSGDKEAFKQIIENTKKEAVQATLTQFSDYTNLQKEVEAIQKEYSNLFDNAGNIKKDEPLAQKTEEVLRLPAFKELVESNKMTPKMVKVAIQLAEANLIKEGLSSRDQKIKNEAQQRIKESGASSLATGISSIQTDNSEEMSLNNDQLSYYKKQGYNQENLKRLSKIVARAHKEGGYNIL
ncbi:MAG: hypothetical protein A2309_02980 [Bacteroidetes bacterium RIFOXYB2_FULL_35_7]|nr:MAG: hypothetical protein A2309_02980 [Bacteroidetes bacterium RIFOXYB2_FULL_35_7]OGF44851.1 MAG: hypothetical protein A2231_10220 [Candidatus Firestonebacteria bacterium RIFOXYA2_FULL_40_8]